MSAPVREESAVPEAPDAPDASATSKAEKTMSRFWKTVGIAFRSREAGDENAQHMGDHYEVQLDRRSLRTPGGSVLRVPADRPLLACLVAQEWDEQTQVLRPFSLPVTSLVSRAIDGLTAPGDRAHAESQLLRYFDTDALCFHEPEPEVLARLQRERWEPLIDWVRQTYDVEIHTTEGLSVAQPPASRAKMAELLPPMSVLDLAAFERSVMTSKSFLLSLALVNAHIDAEQAALAAEVEVASQASAWGAVDDSHDVDHAELRRQLASVACAMVRTDEAQVRKFVQVLEARGNKL